MIKIHCISYSLNSLTLYSSHLNIIVSVPFKRFIIYQTKYFIEDEFNKALRMYYYSPGHDQGAFDRSGHVQAEYMYEEGKKGNIPSSKPGVNDGGYVLPQVHGNGAPEWFQQWFQQPTIRGHNKINRASSDNYDEDHYTLARNSGFNFDSTDESKHGNTKAEKKKGGLSSKTLIAIFFIFVMFVIGGVCAYIVMQRLNDHQDETSSTTASFYNPGHGIQTTTTSITTGCRSNVDCPEERPTCSNGLCYGDTFTYAENTFCHSIGIIKTYATLKQAQHACLNDIKCDLVFDDACNAEKFHTCKGKVKTSTTKGSCTWKKHWRMTASVWCSGHSTFSSNKYSSYQLARDDCFENDVCAAVYDSDCQGDNFKLCPKNYDEKQSKRGACIYHKPGCATNDDCKNGGTCQGGHCKKCGTTVFLASSGLAKLYHSSKLGKYNEDGISNGHMAYKNPNGYYLHYATNGEWWVSAKKGDTSLFFDSNCKAICPKHCTGTWRTFNTSKDPWENDPSLTVTGPDEMITDFPQTSTAPLAIANKERKSSNPNANDEAENENPKMVEAEVESYSAFNKSSAHFNTEMKKID